MNLNEGATMVINFDMLAIGRRIASLRRGKNITQTGLADMLGISFQAVSNWERGVSMPDISKLAELSNIFSVSIDEILGNSSVSDITEKVINNEEITLKEAESIKEIIPPELLKERVSDGERGSGEKIDIATLISLAPFLDEETLSNLVNKLSAEEKYSVYELIGLAPFLSRKSLSKIIDSHLNDEETEIGALMGIIPFLDKEDVSRLVKNNLKRGKLSNSDIAMLAPFLSKKDLKSLLMR